MEKLGHQERRKHPRKACSMDAACATWRGGFSGTIKDISYGGMFVGTDAELSSREDVSASLFPSVRRDPMRVNGQIAWCGPRGVGLRFTSRLSQELEDMIASL